MGIQGTGEQRVQFTGEVTTFFLTDEDGSRLEVNIEGRLTNLPEDGQVTVTGMFERLLAGFVEYFKASTITWE